MGMIKDFFIKPSEEELERRRKKEAAYDAAYNVEYDKAVKTEEARSRKKKREKEREKARWDAKSTSEKAKAVIKKGKERRKSIAASLKESMGEGEPTRYKKEKPKYYVSGGKAYPIASKKKTKKSRSGGFLGFAREYGSTDAMTPSDVLDGFGSRRKKKSKRKGITIDDILS